LVEADSILVARGVLDRRGGGDEANLIINELIPLSQLDTRYTEGIIIRIDETKHDDDMVNRIREITRGYPGGQRLEFMIQLADGCRVRMKSQAQGIEVTSELRGRLDDLLGPGNLQMLFNRPKPQVNAGYGGGYRRNRA